MDTFKRLPYHPSLYVQREGAISVLKSAVENIPRQSGATIVPIDGTRLIGKTWFAMHVMCSQADDMLLDGLLLPERIYVCLEQDGIKQQVELCRERCFYMYPADASGTASTNLSEVELTKLLMRNLLIGLYKQFSISLPAHASFWDIDNWIPELIAQKWATNFERCILFVDGILEAPAEVLALFENHFLKYLLPQANMIIVLLGRPAGNGWYAAPLRAVDAKPVLLTPFSDNQIADQVDKLNKSSKIYPVKQDNVKLLSGFGAGIPGTVSLLVRSGIDHHSLRQIFVQLASDNERDLFFYFWLLAPLNGFEDEMITHLRKLTWVEVIDPLKALSGRDIRNRLVATHLVRWDSAAGLFQMDLAIQVPLQQWTKRNDKESWDKICRAMVDYFEYWMDKAEGNQKIRKIFETQRDYYAIDHRKNEA